MAFCVKRRAAAFFPFRLAKKLISSTISNMPSLYYLKCLCAFFVVCIHSSLYGIEFFAPIIHCAVPCFYMCTGFFLHSDRKEKEFIKLKRWIIKAITLLILINFIYLFVDFLRNNREILWYKWPTSILWGGVISIHLWYLSSLWQGLLIVWILLKISKKTIIIGPLLYIVIYGLNPTLLHIETGVFRSWEEHLMSVTCSTCFLCAGYMISYKNYKSLYSIRWDICIFILAFILLKIKPFSNGVFHVFCSVVEGMSLFSVFVKIDKTHSPYIEWIGKYHSANIYFFHALFISSYGTLIYYCPPLINTQNYRAILFFILSLTLSIFFTIIKKRIISLFMTWRQKCCEDDRKE